MKKCINTIETISDKNVNLVCFEDIAHTIERNCIPPIVPHDLLPRNMLAGQQLLRGQTQVELIAEGFFPG